MCVCVCVCVCARGGGGGGSFLVDDVFCYYYDHVTLSLSVSGLLIVVSLQLFVVGLFFFVFSRSLSSFCVFLLSFFSFFFFSPLSFYSFFFLFFFIFFLFLYKMVLCVNKWAITKDRITTFAVWSLI